LSLGLGRKKTVSAPPAAVTPAPRMRKLHTRCFGNWQVVRKQSNRPLVSDCILRYEIFVPQRSHTRVTEEVYEIARSRCLAIR
jgi:hypothetical protein